MLVICIQMSDGDCDGRGLMASHSYFVCGYLCLHLNFMPFRDFDCSRGPIGDTSDQESDRTKSFLLHIMTKFRSLISIDEL